MAWCHFTVWCVIGSVRLIGVCWLLLALFALLPLISGAHSPLGLLLNCNQSAWVLFAALCGLRAALALCKSPQYRKWFRVGCLSQDNKKARCLHLLLCSVAWFSLTSVSNFTLPPWLIVWGVLAWGWLLLPFMEQLEPVNRRAGFADIPRTNPASGLPMMPSGTVDSGGNPHGMSSHILDACNPDNHH